MELKDTIGLMTSLNWQSRFKAEYLQLKIRYDKLNDKITQRENGVLDFDTPIPLESWWRQSLFMSHYMRELEYQAKLHGIDLKSIKQNCTELI